MTIKSAIPYLILYGRAVQAIEFYKTVLGADVASSQRFGDVQQSCPEAQRALIMHAELRVGEAVLMLSDGPGEAPVPGPGGVQVALALDDAAQLRRVFEGLSAGGAVTQAPLDAPWGDVFCAFADRFGVRWMLTAPQGV